MLLFFRPANVMKWEKAVTDDEKELEKVRNDEARNMEVLDLLVTNTVLYEKGLKKPDVLPT